MNIINTSLIVDPAVQQPLTGKSLTFLQDATKELLSSIVASLDPVAYLASSPIVLQGCEKTSLGGNNYSYNAGFVFFGGEIYYLPVITSVSITVSDQVNIVITNDATADPVTFSDGSVKNVHNVRNVTVVNGTLGTGTFNYADCVFINNPAWNTIGGAGQPAFQNSWADAGGGNAPAFRKSKGLLYLKGVVTGGVSGATIFTLPAAFRPAHAPFLSATSYTSATTFETGLLSVDGSGHVYCDFTGSPDFISLDGIVISLI